MEQVRARAHVPAIRAAAPDGAITLGRGFQVPVALLQRGRRFFGLSLKTIRVVLYLTGAIGTSLSVMSTALSATNTPAKVVGWIGAGCILVASAGVLTLVESGIQRLHQGDRAAVRLALQAGDVPARAVEFAQGDLEMADSPTVAPRDAPGERPPAPPARIMEVAPEGLEMVEVDSPTVVPGEVRWERPPSPAAEEVVLELAIVQGDDTPDGLQGIRRGQTASLDQLRVISGGNYYHVHLQEERL